MATRATRLLAVSMIGFLLAPATRSDADEMKRIRTDSTYLRTVVAEAAVRSPTLRALVRQIEESDVIVHVTCEHLNSAMLEGRTMWVSATPSARYLRVQVECMLTRTALVAILGHELQHVAEIAAAVDVVDRRSFARLFNTIGFSTCGFAEQYETSGAMRAGERVRQEFVSARRPVTPRLTAAP